MRRFAPGFLGLALVAAIGGSIGPARAETWPSRPVTLVVPYAPGGNIDLAARVIARELSEKLGQQFVVESKGGAGGTIGAAAVAKAQPDGYTLLVTANGPAVLNKLLYASLPYDPDADFVPISLISDVPQVIIVNPKLPIGNLKDLIAYARKKSDGLSMGHPGIGTGGHLASLRFADLAGFKVVPIAYRGAAPIVTAVLGGEIDSGLPAYIPQVKAVKVVAVTSQDRVAFLPGVPTAREGGVDMVTGTFTALVAPKGVAPAIIDRMNRILDAFLKTDAAKSQLEKLGARVLGGPPARVTERMDHEKATWGPIVKSANIKLQ